VRYLHYSDELVKAADPSLQQKESVAQKSGCVTCRIQVESGEEVGPLRVWVQNAWVPGLAMSRALGDTVARR
jgi:hypothetical protein